ncbi:hypothetical protein [Oligoflexus tunisiensis]|uniref:hypothetical protein n=1 Tax=Oligoflexus tunisiensis TaxID=708132 RepID=UPI00114D1E49|nr:hypothetical protein [Oligoflexus tunisiensis]
MHDREPPIFSPYDPMGAGRLAAAAAPKRSWLSTAALTLLAICMTFAGLILGFVVGDSFGRRNAQYDNPDLREYYAGKCYDYWETQLKQTLNSSLQRDAEERQGHGQKLDEIFFKMQELERAMTEFTAVRGSAQSMEAEKSSVAATRAATPRKM